MLDSRLSSTLALVDDYGESSQKMSPNTRFHWSCHSSERQIHVLSKVDDARDLVAWLQLFVVLLGRLNLLEHHSKVLCDVALRCADSEEGHLLGCFGQRGIFLTRDEPMDMGRLVKLVVLEGNFN